MTPCVFDGKACFAYAAQPMDRLASGETNCSPLPGHESLPEFCGLESALLLNGLLVTTTKINSFIATLSTMMVYRGIAMVLAGATTPNEIDVLVGLRITLSRIFPWSTGFTRSDFCWGAVAPHGCSGGGKTVVPKSNGQVLRVGPRASRVAMRAHNRKIRFSPWRYLNLLDLHSLETLAEWTGKAAVLVSLCGQVAHATPPLIRGFGCLRHQVQDEIKALPEIETSNSSGKRT